MDVRLLLILIFLAACQPQPQVGSGRLSEDSSNGTDATIPDSTTGWNYLGSISKSIQVNVANLNVAYIVGKNAESFLGATGNFDRDYCLVSRYIVGGATKEMRNKIVPVSYYDFTAKRTVRIFRVDFPENTSSSTVCGSSTLSILNADGNLENEGVTYTVIHKPADLCTTCTSVLQSYKNSLFVVNESTGILEELAVAKVDIRALSLAIDPNNNAANGTGTCSQSACVARGFDCCLENQCVNDGAVRPSAMTQYYQQWQTAEQEKLQNPLAYLNYPHLYYICGNTVPTTGGSASGSSGGASGGYDAGFEALKKDYYCVESMKSNKVSATFHQDLFLSPTTFPHVTTTDRECYTTSLSGETMWYRKVAERLYRTCGCSRTDLQEMITYCPAYEYTVSLTDAVGNPTRIDCYTPPTNGGGGVPSTQNVSVNSRSAPHRFFDSSGTERNILAGGTSYTQEGDSFSYLDDSNIVPSQSDFGMNAILGQMTVTLDKALPAKHVTVELDQLYTLSTTSGYFTPCPSCGKDSWLSTLSAFPSSAYGAGLQAVGHTTTRDEFSTNTTGGNYEDTIFGRACWIPPTMIPFSHLPTSLVTDSTYAGLQRQRMNRLKTQAAYFANGYQRDWYGFNKGALIGSFDGVTWFAIGKGRVVKATSKKLFLAINAPFADLNSPTMHVVNVSEYDGVTTAAQVDYDPQYSLSHPYQNEAGNCQATHLCDTDTDCVTRLGWEYMCADVRDVKTNWPVFDADGNERNDLSTNVTIDQILLQKRFPSSSTKRCVYRGAGAPCIVNSSGITDANQRKVLSCAPNFYCAGVNSGPYFNGKPARYGAALEDIPVSRNHLFGKDANVLGRPLNYVNATGGTSLPSGVQDTIASNLASNNSFGTTFSGLCQPGKALPTSTTQTTMYSPYLQHQSRDTSGRADFINQISSCNSTLFTSYRYSSCPVIGSDGNYEMFSSSSWATNHVARSRAQNSCGLDSLYTGTVLSGSADTLLAASPFKNIEAKTLATTTVLTPTLTRDACLRRAGQVCHTDLDCGPNKYHAEQTDYFTTAYFGNAAEKQYYQESLICGQTDPKPLQSDTVAFRNYQMNQNRCCREQGLDLTTYTSDIPTNTRAASAADYVAATFDLRSWITAGTDPANALRYSRLASVDGLTAPDSVVNGTTTKPPLSAYQVRSSGYAGKRKNTTTGAWNGTGINVNTKYQWSTLGTANSNTCCGGGWIRKFADGSTDWTRRDRVYLDVANFKCINSKTPLLTHPSDVAAAYDSTVANLVQQDIGDYCIDNSTANGACALWPITNSLNDLYPGSSSFGTFYIDTIQPAFTTYPEYYFKPRSNDNNPAVIIDYALTTGRRNINIKIPSFVPDNDGGNSLEQRYTANTLSVQLYDYPATTNTLTCGKFHGMTFTDQYTTGIPNGSCGGAACCYSYNHTTRVFNVALSDLAAAPAGWANRRVGLKINHLLRSAGLVANISRTAPGTNTYYVKRLGKLELSGIPQITYEPLYCNDNDDYLVPGLFKANAYQTTMSTYVDFQNANFSFLHTDGTYRTNRHGLDHDAVFSENDFKCCTPLGSQTTATSKCCSGYGVPTGSKYTCVLPAGTDLMVYFNRFVSNEGRGTTQPGGGLVDADFDPETGEPLVSTAVNTKISALGTAYCRSMRVRQGGAFGNFPLEPVGSSTSASERIYGIVDSSADIGQTSNGGQTVTVGYQAFMNGFRWNHHLYCDD